MAFTFSNDQFSGPLELLLELIHKRKMPINDISLAEVTDEYLRYLEGIDRARFGDVTHFLVIAATLILIKSRSLLPTIELSDEEEDSISDLERRLKILEVYQRHREALNEKMVSSSRLYFGKGETVPMVFAPDPAVTPMTLSAIIKEVFHSVPKPIVHPEVRVRTVVHIEDMMQSLETRLRDAMKTSFRQLTAPRDGMNHAEARVHAIVGFLAMLEMVKNGLCDVIQETHYEDIAIERI